MTKDSNITAQTLDGRNTDSRTREALIRITIPADMIRHAMMTAGHTLDHCIAEAAREAVRTLLGGERLDRELESPETRAKAEWPKHWDLGFSARMNGRGMEARTEACAVRSEYVSWNGGYLAADRKLAEQAKGDKDAQSIK